MHRVLLASSSGAKYLASCGWNRFFGIELLRKISIRHSRFRLLETEPLNFQTRLSFATATAGSVSVSSYPQKDREPETGRDLHYQPQHRSAEPNRVRPEAAMEQQAFTTHPPGRTNRSFYKRELPSPPSTALSSSQGQNIFQDAMSQGMLRGFFPLIEQFRTQDDPAFCGLASVAMVLNALAIDPRRLWKGPWRIFHEQMLDCCVPLETVQKEGITLSGASCLARCNGATTQVFSFGSVTVEEFRRMVIEACSTANFHLIVSYSRKHFLQTGDGHFSPIGGYSPTHDSVLILDTARFKYPPHWVPLSMLYDAMEYCDPTTGKPRGFIKVTSSPVLQSVLFALNVGREEVDATRIARTFVTESIPAILQRYHQNNSVVLSILLDIASSIPDAIIEEFMVSRTSNAGCFNGACVQHDAVEMLLCEMQMFELYKSLKDREIVSNPRQHDAEKRFLFTLMCSDSIEEHIKDWPDAKRLEVQTLLDASQHAVVRHEVIYLKEQYNALVAQYQND
jgi:glutathione gamma-glutamylcysteinyltransferase